MDSIQQDERWQLALDGMRENSQQYQTLVKIIQNGFGTIGERLDGYGRRISTLEGELLALKMDGQARAGTMRLLMALVIALLVFSIIQTSLWWYVVARLFNV